MTGLSQDIAKFVVEARFESLPEAIVHEAKRSLLDSFGCALIGSWTDKGKIAMRLAERLGGPTESSIIGTGNKVSCCGAAFANGELINAMDYDVINLPTGHVAPYVTPAVLAMAESTGASGRDLILAVVLAHELSDRITSALGPLLQPPPEGSLGKENLRWAQAHGHSQCVFGAAAGVGKILKFDHKQMVHALGIAGHFCPVPTHRKWAETVPSVMGKYGAPGWVADVGVTTALLAQMGYLGDPTVFDGEHGFWKFYAAEKWMPNKITDRLGESWLFAETKYKFYPCCHAMHTPLDCFRSIIDNNNLTPGDIESVHVLCNPLVELPLWRDNELATGIDAQFSVPYVMAAAAYRLQVEHWQDPDKLGDPNILEFMKKVTFQLHPRFAEGRPRSAVGAVEVKAKGKTFREERKYARGTPFTEFQASDADLADKFRRNAATFLTPPKIEQAIQLTMELEKVQNVADLVKQITL